MLSTLLQFCDREQITSIEDQPLLSYSPIQKLLGNFYFCQKWSCYTRNCIPSIYFLLKSIVILSVCWCHTNTCTMWLKDSYTLPPMKWGSKLHCIIFRNYQRWQRTSIELCCRYYYRMNLWFHKQKNLMYDDWLEPKHICYRQSYYHRSQNPYKLFWGEWWLLLIFELFVYVHRIFCSLIFQQLVCHLLVQQLK